MFLEHKKTLRFVQQHILCVLITSVFTLQSLVFCELIVWFLFLNMLERFVFFNDEFLILVAEKYLDISIECIFCKI